MKASLRLINVFFSFSLRSVELSDLMISQISWSLWSSDLSELMDSHIINQISIVMSKRNCLYLIEESLVCIMRELLGVMVLEWWGYSWWWLVRLSQPWCGHGSYSSHTVDHTIVTALGLICKCYNSFIKWIEISLQFWFQLFLWEIEMIPSA